MSIALKKLRCLAKLPWEGIARAVRDGLAQLAWEGIARAVRDGLAKLPWEGVARAVRDGLAQLAWEGVARAVRDGLAQLARERIARATGRYFGVSKTGYYQNGGQNCNGQKLHGKGLPGGLGTRGVSPTYSEP
jgi:hypothetical protein